MFAWQYALNELQADKYLLKAFLTSVNSMEQVFVLFENQTDLILRLPIIVQNVNYSELSPSHD